MSKWVWVGLVAAVAAAGVIAVVIAPASNTGFEEDAAALTFIALVALGIERVLEIWWNLVGSRYGGWWPLSLVTSAMKDAEEQANTLLDPVVQQIQESLAAEKAAAAAAGGDVAKFNKQLQALTSKQAELRTRLAAAQKLAPGSARMSLVTGIVDEGLGAATKAAKLTGQASTAVGAALDVVQHGTNVATDIVSAFDDNPARRTMSILLGASLGMLVAGFLGLNLFAAILDDAPAVVTGVAGIVLTGVIMGIGSSPTHEVIKALQQYKESRKPSEPGVKTEKEGDEPNRAAAARYAFRNAGSLRISALDAMPVGDGSAEGGARRIVPLRSTE